MSPPRAPLRVSLARAAAAHSRGAARRLAEERQAAFGRIRRFVPALALIAVALYAGWRASGAAATLPVARWMEPSQVASAPIGTAVWVEGTVVPMPGRTLADPLADQSVVAYAVSVRRSIQRAAYDAAEQRIETRQVAHAAGTERDVACWVADDAGRVKVGSVTPDPATSMALSWSAGQRVPAPLAKLPEVFRVVPGERLVALEVSRARVREGDRVAVYGVVARDDAGEVCLAPPAGQACPLLDGGWSAWRSRALETLVPWWAATVAAIFLVGVTLRRARAEIVPTSTPGGDSP